MTCGGGSMPVISMPWVPCMTSCTDCMIMRHRLLLGLLVDDDGAVGLDVDGAGAHEVGAQDRHHLRRDVLAGHRLDSVSASKFWPMISAFRRSRSRTKLPACLLLRPRAGDTPIEPLMRCAVAVSRGLGGTAHDVRDAHDLVDRPA